jgi:PTS system N-acetylglucosamine-specific IIC component
MALTNALGIRDGFAFSAGLFDYALNWNIATRPALIILIGAGYAALYYFLFRFIIRWFKLKTPGREEADEESMIEADTSA